jgi:hypothetical protein
MKRVCGEHLSLSACRLILAPHFEIAALPPCSRLSLPVDALAPQQRNTPPPAHLPSLFRICSFLQRKLLIRQIVTRYPKGNGVQTSSGAPVACAFVRQLLSQSLAHTHQTQFIAALGNPAASSGTNVHEW